MPRVIADNFVSYAQNGEDVILWRALRDVADGRYLDVGAWDPVVDSVTKAFYERGWRGVNVEPMPEAADRLRRDRPDDEIVEAAVSAVDGGQATLHQFSETGLATLVDGVATRHEAGGLHSRDVTVSTTTLDAVIEASPLLSGDIHFLKIDVEGAEREVLESLTLTTHRPWVIVVEATAPNSTVQTHGPWEQGVLDAGYEFCLFDGLSRYYVADEHSELKAALSYPACVLDNYVKMTEIQAQQNLDSVTQAHAEAAAARAQLWDDALRWRALALDAWSDGFGKVAELEARQERLKARVKGRVREARLLRRELTQMQSSLSWRVTKPLRWIRSRGPHRVDNKKATSR